MDTLRTRAIEVLGGAGIVTSVFGGLVIRKDQPMLFVLRGAAVAAFVVLAVFACWC
jgi:hypothetical protein